MQRKKVVRYTINNIPKNVANIDLWYESGKLYALSSVDNADIRLSCTDIDLLVKGSTDFDALPWEELFIVGFVRNFLRSTDLRITAPASSAFLTQKQEAQSCIVIPNLRYYANYRLRQTTGHSAETISLFSDYCINQNIR